MTRHLYIHIPFCNQICSFCDFKRIQTNEYELMAQYVQKLIYQLSFCSIPKQYETIYLGGGTPNHLPDDLLIKILKELNTYLADNGEFSIECNPDLITKSQVEIFATYKINRVSLGVQSTNNKILKNIKRTHQIEDVERAIILLQSNNITNINCDFIYDLPNTTNEDLKNAINFANRHHIPHLSFYALELKPNALLTKQNYQLDLNNQEDKMVLLHKLLNSAGYQRYEVSNWVKDPQYVCKHNLAYWLTQDWKALGYGGCGFEHLTNYKILGSIKNFYVTEIEFLNEYDYYFQILMMGLRLVNGVDLSVEKYFKAYKYFQNKLEDCIIINNHLQAKNIDLLDNVLIKIM